MDTTLKLTEALTSLVQVFIWPSIILFMLIKFGKPLTSFFENLSEFKLKAGGVEASATRGQIKAAALLGAASQKSSPDDGGKPKDVDTNEIASAVSALARDERTLRKLTRILWVDDRPRNNDYERRALEQMGIEFGIATSTDEAIEELGTSRYDLIISDMGRPPDSRAGYTLLDYLRDEGNQIGYVIYAGSNLTEHKREAIKHGAIGSTNRADELFLLVSKGLDMARQ